MAQKQRLFVVTLFFHYDTQPERFGPLSPGERAGGEGGGIRTKISNAKSLPQPSPTLPRGEGAVSRTHYNFRKFRFANQLPDKMPPPTIKKSGNIPVLAESMPNTSGIVH